MIICKEILPAYGGRKRTHAARSAWAAAQNDINTSSYNVILSNTKR